MTSFLSLSSLSCLACPSFTTSILLSSASQPHPAAALAKKSKKVVSVGGMFANFAEVIEQSMPFEYTSEGASEPPTSAAPSSRASSPIDVDSAPQAKTRGKKKESEDGVNPGGISDGEDARDATLTSAYTHNIAGTVSFIPTKPIKLEHQAKTINRGKKKKATNNDLPTGTKELFTCILIPWIRVKCATLPETWCRPGDHPTVWDPPKFSDLAFMWLDYIIPRLGATHPSNGVRMQPKGVIHELIIARIQNWRGYFVDDALFAVKDLMTTLVDPEGLSTTELIHEKALVVQYLLEPTVPNSTPVDVSRKFMWRDLPGGGDKGEDDTGKDEMDEGIPGAAEESEVGTGEGETGEGGSGEGGSGDDDPAAGFEGLFHSKLILYPLAHHLHLLHDFQEEEGVNSPVKVTIEGKAWPRGAVILAAMTARKALEQFTTGEFVKAKDTFSATTWGSTTEEGKWAQDLLGLVNTLDDDDWTALMAAAEEYRVDYFSKKKHKGHILPPPPQDLGQAAGPAAPPPPPAVLSFKKKKMA